MNEDGTGDGAGAAGTFYSEPETGPKYVAQSGSRNRPKDARLRKP